MAAIKFDKDSFVEALEPGIVSYVVQKFKDRLEEKLNRATEETYKELLVELPGEIKAKVLDAFCVSDYTRKVEVKVDIKCDKETEA